MQNSIKTAFITGITGQDGWYLAHNLLAKGYRVHGIARHLRPGQHCAPFDRRIELMRACLTDPGQIKAALLHSRPDEIYNLAAFSRTYASRAFPEAVLRSTAWAPYRYSTWRGIFVPPPEFSRLHLPKYSASRQASRKMKVRLSIH